MEYNELEEFVQQFINGDEEAFEKIYKATYKIVYFTCYKSIESEEEAKDVTQEVFLTVYNKLSEYSEDKFVGWIKRIAANKSIDYLRKKNRMAEIDTDDSMDESLLEDDNLENLPEYYINQAEKRKIFEQIMRENLSDVQFNTLFFHYYNELPVEEIAERMSCPVGTVKTRLKSARCILKDAIKKYEKEYDVSLAAMGGVPFLTRFFTQMESACNIPTVPFVLPGAATGSAAKAGLGVAAKAASKPLSSAAAKAVGVVLSLAVVGGGAAVILNNQGEVPPTPSTSVVSSIPTTEATTTETTISYTDIDPFEYAIFKYDGILPEAVPVVARDRKSPINGFVFRLYYQDGREYSDQEIENGQKFTVKVVSAKTGLTEDAVKLFEDNGYHLTRTEMEYEINAPFYVSDIHQIEGEILDSMAEELRQDMLKNKELKSAKFLGASLVKNEDGGNRICFFYKLKSKYETGYQYYWYSDVYVKEDHKSVGYGFKFSFDEGIFVSDYYPFDTFKQAKKDLKNYLYDGEKIVNSIWK